MGYEFCTFEHGSIGRCWHLPFDYVYIRYEDALYSEFLVLVRLYLYHARQVPFWLIEACFSHGEDDVTKGAKTKRA